MYPVPGDLLPIGSTEMLEEPARCRTSGECNGKSTLFRYGLFSSIPEELCTFSGELLRIFGNFENLAQSGLQALPSFRRSSAALAGPSVPEAYI